MSCRPLNALAILEYRQDALIWVCSTPEFCSRPTSFDSRLIVSSFRPASASAYLGCINQRQADVYARTVSILVSSRFDSSHVQIKLISFHRVADVVLTPDELLAR